MRAGLELGPEVKVPIEMNSGLSRETLTHGMDLMFYVIQNPENFIY